MVQHEIEALEAFFTPESDRSKVFVTRVVHLVKSLAVDENDTVNLLLSAYSIRSAHVHRGEGWDEFHPPVSTTDRALHSWESYAGDLATVLIVYLRLSIVSRILSQSDERSYIEMLDKSIETGVVDSSLSGQTKYLSCRIRRINDFLPISQSVREVSDTICFSPGGN